MLVELNIKLNARERGNGLYELRPCVGGVRYSIYGRTPEELARKYRQFLAERRKREKAEAKSALTLFGWFDEWLEVYKKPNISKNSYYNLKRCIDKHIKPNLKDKPLNRYDLTELTQALNCIESTRMRKYARGALQQAFKDAVYAGKLTSSPAQNLSPIKHVAKNGKAYALLDVLEMIENAPSVLPRDAIFYNLFCLFAGTRRNEAYFLRTEDLDFKNRIIYVHGTKTQGSDRRVPMFPILEKILRAMDPKPGELVFKIPMAKRDDNFRLFRGDRPGVQHWLRHTFGTVQVCMFLTPVNTVAMWMGHSDASTTMDIYTHPEDLAPDIYFSGNYSESEKIEILKERYNKIISAVERLL